MKQYDDAITYYHKAIALAHSDGNTYEEGATYGLLAQMYMDIEKTDEAVECFEKAKELLDSSNRTSNNMAIVKYLHQLYRKQGKADKAYDTLLSYTDMRFKLQNEVRIKEVVALQEKYEAGKRDAELQQIRLQQAESELKALKAQMNPHFVFNALNSIQEVFFLGDKRLANKHLSRFSTLIRNILKVSGQTSILLHDEINMLQEYLQLEALRFGDTFTYSIDIEEAIDVYNIDVPPMIVQPFVENAIKHGLMHRQGEQQLMLSMHYNHEQNMLIVCVADNGVGRAASADINQYRQGHQSFATTALQKRFEYLNMKSEQPYKFEYRDLYKDNVATGTEVYIHLPIKN
jgi:LytS/YehU family sensor histidine kinase